MRRLIGKSVIILAMIVVSLSPVRSDAAEKRGMDYFDPKYRAEIEQVEEYHLGKETFWKQFNSKQYGYALQELKFALRYFPNHPKHCS